MIISQNVLEQSVSHCDRPELYFLTKYFFSIESQEQMFQEHHENLLSSFRLNINNQALPSVERSPESDSFTIEFIRKKPYLFSIYTFHKYLVKCVILCHKFLAPDSPPQNFTVKQLSGVTVMLSWQPPLEPNGIILYYTVYVW